MFTINAYQIDFRAVIDEMVSHASIPREQFLASTIQDTRASNLIMRQNVLLSTLVFVDSVAGTDIASEFVVIQDISYDMIQLARSVGLSAIRALF